MMEEKTQSKIAVHQVLIKNGFYRLPMQSLSEILKLLDMPESLEPKVIQENAINGIIKVIDKYANKFGQYITLPKFTSITRETKDFVTLLFQDSLASISKKNTPHMGQGPPLLSQQPPPNGMLSMYNPINQYNYMRPPNLPPTELPPGQNQNVGQSGRYLQEAMRMQQMYMYYYGMYGGFNPMMNPQYPGMNNYMNPYSNYSTPPNPSKNPSQHGVPNMPIPPVNPMPSMNHMGMGMNPMSGYNPMGAGMNNMMGMPNLGVNSLKNSMVPPLPSKANKMQEQMTSLVNTSNKNVNLGQSKQMESSKINPSSKSKPVEEKKADKIPQLSKAASQSSLAADIKKADKKKANQASTEKPKGTAPPFSMGEVQPSSLKRIIKQQSKEMNAQANPLLRHCACKGYEKFEEQFLCSICNRTFHFHCLNEPMRKQQSKEAIECYHCRMRFIDPLNKVKEVIAENYIPNITENKFFLQCNLKPYEYLCKQKKKNEVRNEIEMRCLKVSHAENNEITWPDECIIKLNGERIIQIPALQMNSSLKKRKDYSIIITSNIYNKIAQSDSQSLEKVKLSLEIKTLSKEEASHKKIKNSYTFAFAIYFIQRLTVDQLYERIVSQEKVPYVPDYMTRLMKTGEKEVEIDKISISLRDPYTWDLIKTPVRGNKCLHGQCFDLKTFISFMFTARNRTWKCPVCNKDARKFTVDIDQMELIKKAEESSGIPLEVQFLKNGQIVVKADNASDEEENSAMAQVEKTKKIQKSPKPQRGQRMEVQQKEERNFKQMSNDEKRASKDVAKEIILDIESDN